MKLHHFTILKCVILLCIVNVRQENIEIGYQFPRIMLFMGGCI